MQRRAAAIYAVVFVLIGTASYTLIATAEQPHVSFENPEYELSQGDTFQVGDRTYTVSSISASAASGGGGHGGGGGGVTRSGELQWTNQSGRHTATWEKGANVTLDGTRYVVRIPEASGGSGGSSGGGSTATPSGGSTATPSGGSTATPTGDGASASGGSTPDPSSFTLEQGQNRTAILQNDSAADNQTVTRSGQEYVVVTENGTSQLVPAAEYFPEPERTQYSEGDELQYKGNTTTVTEVTNEGVELAWTAPKTNTVELSPATNKTISGQQYFVHFPDNSTVILESDYSVYQEQAAEIDRFHEHKNGLWGVTTLSGVAVVLLVGMAYLPSRY